MGIYHSSRRFINKDTIYALYYAIILLLTFWLSKPYAEYGLERYVYMLAVVAPLFFNKSYIALALPLFWGISQSSFTVLLPTNNVYILLVAVALCITELRITRQLMISLVSILYLLCIELFGIVPYFECAICGASAMFISLSVVSKQDIKKLGSAFGMMSLVLSILFLIYFEEFSDTYASVGFEQVERASWINANVFGGVIGIGMVSSIFLLTLSKEFIINNWHKLICIVTVLVSLVVLIMNASRGALIASVVSSLLLLTFSKLKKSYLLLIFLLLTIFVVVLYNAGYFELLELRTIGDDNTTDTAGGRTEIWEAKLNAFTNLSIFQQCFGIGYDECVNLGIYFDTHNDFVTALCAYGYIGFCLFIALLVYPLVIARKNKRLVVLSLLLFLILECFVLSPILRGYFIFFLFYVMILKFAVMSESFTNAELQTIE